VRGRVRAPRDAIPSGQSWTWAIVAPRGASPSVAYPKLPVDSVAVGDAVAIEDLSGVQLSGGCDAFRARGFTDLTTAIIGASGRLVAELPYSVALH